MYRELSTMKKLLIILLLSLITILGCGNQSKSEGNQKPIAYMSAEDMFPNDTMTQALVEAASDGDVEEIDELVAKGADVNAIGTFGCTPLVWVIEHPNKVGFKRLLEHGADPNLQQEGSNFSPLQWAVRSSSPLGGNLDLDYLRMLFVIGGGNPNLTGRKNGELLIDLSLLPGEEHVFMFLLNAGAGVDRIGAYGASVIYHAAEVNNFKIVYYLLEKGVNYLHVPHGRYSSWTLMNMINKNFKWKSRCAVDPRAQQYMWFWRVVDFLEKRGMKFEIPQDMKRPAVMDTTPVSFDSEPPRAHPFTNVFIHEVNLTYPTPSWAQTEETADNLKTRFQQKGGFIMYESIPKNDSPENWTQYQSVLGLYAPGESFEEFVETIKAKLSGMSLHAANLQPLEQADNRQLFHVVCVAPALEGVLFVGRHKDTFVTVYQIWRPGLIQDDKAKLEKVVADMRKINMEDGYSVTPMTEEMDQLLKQ